VNITQAGHEDGLAGGSGVRVLGEGEGKEYPDRDEQSHAFDSTCKRDVLGS